MKSLRVFFYFLAIILVAFACKNNANKSDAEALEEVMLEETKEIIASIPAPNSLVVMNLLNESGAGYIYDIANKTDYIDNYITIKQKALALGVYSADLSYVSIYNQQEESAEYIKTFQQLVDELEIPVVDADFIEKMQNSIGEKEAMIALVNEAFGKANTYLNSSDRVDIALYVLYGSWIETVYLLKKTIEFSTNRGPLVKIVLQNKITLDKIIELLENKKEEKDFGEYHYTLTQIRTLFESLSQDPTDEGKINALKSAVKEARANII